MFGFGLVLVLFCLLLVRLACAMNFVGLGYLESTIPGGWVGGVVEKLGNKANLRSFGLDLQVWQKQLKFSGVFLEMSKFEGDFL